jgi:glycosyltransferase involved in cell wall biosynthesis
MRIMIVSDAWFPQTNGVVNTLAQTAAWLVRFGHEVMIAAPRDFRTVPCPSYPEIRIAVRPMAALARRVRTLPAPGRFILLRRPARIRRAACRLRHGWRFTTSYHTQFPQYLKSRWPIPLWLSYAALRRYHAAAQRCMVSTQSVENELHRRGFRNLVRWQRGVDTELFRPQSKEFLQLPRPIAAYVGRLAVEKNVDAFLQMPWRGSKIVIGDGPERARLEARYREAVYAGFRFGEDLAAHLAAADVLVFPSLTDTFGLVNLEAMACGVPVAAFPITGPIDVVEDGVTGALDPDLGKAAERALRLDPRACRARALQSSWTACTREFETNLITCRPGPLPRSAAERPVIEPAA